MTKTITKISDTNYRITETKEVVEEVIVTLDQLEERKLSALQRLNIYVTEIKEEVAEIDKQITDLKAEGAKTAAEVAEAFRVQEKADRDAEIADEKAKADDITDPLADPEA